MKIASLFPDRLYQIKKQKKNCILDRYTLEMRDGIASGSRTNVIASNLIMKISS